MSEGEIRKQVRDGKVAVIVSSGYGAGWYSWNGDEEMLFDPNIVYMIENDSPTEEIANYCRRKYPDAYLGGNIEKLRVYWIPQGEEFQIEEYDGQECIRLRKREKWLKA